MPVLNRLQNGTVVLPALTLSTTVTLTHSVDSSKAFLVFSCSYDSNSPSTGLVAGELTTPSLLTFVRGDTTGAPAITIEWYVAEFISGVSVQRGSLSFTSGTSADVSISTVTLGTTFPIISFTSADTLLSQNDFIRADIISSTVLRLTVTAAPTATVKWQVITITDSIVQHGDLAWGTADLNLSVSINPVVTNRAWLIFSYQSASGSGNNVGQKMVRGQVASTSQLIFDRDNSGQVMTLSWYLVEFTDNTTVQHGSTQFGTGELVKDTLISKVNRNQSIITAGAIASQGGKTPYSATDNPGVASAIFDLTSSTNLQMTRGLTGSATADIAWFIIDFTDTGEIPPAQPQRILCTPDPILRFTDGDKIVDILASGSGWKLMDPYWRPQIAQYKGGGQKVNPSIAPGQRLVHKEYDNVIETFPLEAVGVDEEACIATINELLSLSRQSADYWAESYEFDDVWIEAKPAGVDSQTGYAQITQMRIAELGNVFGQPFFSPYKESIMDGLTLTVEREPLWRAVPPGEIIGPLYNHIRNPDFELWNSGIADSQPDNWTDLETIQITGDNSRQSTAVHSGNYALKVHVGGSTLTGRIKGVTQTLSGIKALTEYTVIAWVRSDGVSNGVGRILVTYSSQLEVYRESVQHGWTLYTGKFTTGDSDTVGINCEILTTAANTDGAVYFDSLMLIEGDWEQFAIDGVLPYITGSHIVNHWDQSTGVIEAGDINYVDVYNVPGTEDALVRLEVINDTTPTTLGNPTEVIAVLRIGMRRAGNIFSFQGYQDPAGAVDTAASSNNRINSGTLSTTTWTTVATQIIETPSITVNNAGRYRLFVRAFDTRTGGVLTLQIRVRYWIGAGITGIKTLEAVTVPILNNWCVVDLTPNAGINFDTKFDPNPPSQFGFEIQMRRTANTDQGRIDYALLLPTDGGIMVGNINPAVIQNDGVVIDCTVPAPKVFGARLVSIWNIVSQTGAVSGFTHNRLKNFNNALFIMQGGDIFKYQNNVMTYFDITTVAISGNIVVFGNRLYLFAVTGPSEGYASDGNSFPGTLTFTIGPAGGTVIRDALAYNGQLYIAGQDSTNANAVLYAWNGTAATATLTINRLDLDEFFAIGVYKNNLYLAAAAFGGGGIISIYEYNLTSGSLVSTLNTGSVSTTINFTEFDGKLWMTNRSATIYSYDGSAWTTVSPFPALTPLYRGINSIDGVLFVTGRDTAAAVDTIIVIKSTDGVTWELDYHPAGTIAAEGTALEKSQGQLMLGTFEGFSGSPKLHAKSISPNEYQISDYQLVPFRSPPKEKNSEKRHRYIFNWDRNANINNIDDAALVGIGFIPRYLALRGKG